MSELVSPPTLSVTEANELINDTLTQTVGQLLVEGEVASVRVSRNTWLSFTLKDKHSSVECFTHVRKMSVALEDGMRVRILATPRLYVPFGKFSLSIIAIEPVGEGALRRAYERLLKKLADEGLFEPTRKRPLPKFPATITLVTSPDGAALHDIRRVLSERWGGFTLQLIPVAVQGMHAVAEILDALFYLNTQTPDVIILTRGGGSLEDLQAFNDERVARAVAASRAPIIVAIGHERDVSIAELVADSHAATPSNAAQLAVPDRETIALEFANLEQRLTRGVEVRLTRYQQTITRNLTSVGVVRHSLGARLTGTTVRVQAWKQQTGERLAHWQVTLSQRHTQLHKAVAERLRSTAERLQHAHSLIRQLGPQQILDRGYSFTVVAQSGSIVRAARDVSPGTILTTRLAQGTIASEVIHAET